MRATTHPVRQPRPECARQTVCAEELARLETTQARLVKALRGIVGWADPYSVPGEHEASHAEAVAALKEYDATMKGA